MFRKAKDTSSPHQSRRIVLIIIMCVGFCGLNAVSFMHAYRLTHFVAEGNKTESPEDLSTGAKLTVLLTGVKMPKKANSRTPRDFGHRYEEVTIRGEDGFATPVWEIECPAPRRTIIMFHGFSSNKSDLLPVANLLAGNDTHLVLVDFPGHGDSPYAWTTLGHREADIVHTIFKHYAAKYPKATFLWGVSLGASAILTAVHRHQIEPHGLILEMPYTSLYDTVKERFALMGFPISFPFAELLLFWGSIQQHFNAFELTPGEFASAVTCPVLLLGGELDRRAPSASLKKLAATITGDTTFCLFPGVGHESLYHASPLKYERLIEQFLNPPN